MAAKSLWSCAHGLSTSLWQNLSGCLAIASSFVYSGSLPAYVLFWAQFLPKLEITLSKVAEEEDGNEDLYFQVRNTPVSSFQV